MSISQNTLLWELIGSLWSVLCVSMVLCLILDSPEPWLGPVVCMQILSSCSYPPGQWCNCEHGWILGFSFSPSLWLVLFLVSWEEQVQCCHHVSCTNKQYSCWLLLACGKAFYCCACDYSSASSSGLGAMGVQWGCLIMGERWCAAASLWLEYVPSICLAIGPRQSKLAWRSAGICHISNLKLVMKKTFF